MFVPGLEFFMEHSWFDFATGIESDLPVCGYCRDFAATFQLILMIACFQLVSLALGDRALLPCIFQWLLVNEVVSPCLCCP